MSYVFEIDGTIEQNVKRILHEQAASALEELTAVTDDPDDAIHSARKHFKKMRALLRLVRFSVGDDYYKRENVRYRDAGRLLSDVRDAKVMVDTLDNLREFYGDRLAEVTYNRLRNRLVANHEAHAKAAFEDEGLREQAALMVGEGKEQIDSLPIGDGYRAIAGGLHKVYKRGRNRYEDAYEKLTPESFHEWRKRAKYLWYHIRLLAPVWPALVGPLEEEIHRLTDYLGDAHDYAVLRACIQTQFDGLMDETEAQMMLTLIGARQNALEDAARPLGARIFAQPPGDFVERMGAYWRVWRSEDLSAE